MSVVIPSLRAAVAVPGWAKNALWRNARAVPSLDLRFADNKSLVDAVTGASLITFTRASSGTYVDSAGVLQTAATDVPRFDHDPTTGESLGLLPEEQRTNSIRNNTMVGAVAGTPGTIPTNWGDVPTSNGLNRQIVGIGTQNGITYIDIRYSGTTTATSTTVTQPEPSSATVAANGQSWTASSWLALVGGSTSGLTVIQRVTGRSAVGGFLENTDTTVALSSTLTRYVASITMANALTLRVSSDIVLSYSSGAAIDITLRIGLPQLEQGATVSSVIPTTTAAATRSADVASVGGTAFTSFYNQSGGTWFGDVFREFAVPASQFPVIVDCRTSGGSPDINQFSYLLESLAGMFVSVGGVTQSELYPTGLTGVRRRRIATAYAANNFAASANGSTPLIDSTGSVGNPSSMTIGAVTGGTQHLNGHIRRLTYWPQALPSRLQALTQ